ncbi:MAG TPA: universal stress protein [Thermoanaerobaculaceae bacterium]|nr:universal stress protein [Thermoanaerobaculaceae bacterium]HRS15296.1 universal stress protein [Thermoanaerobaculaceae bacterium]
MLPVKKILCPTDFSEPSYVALGAAAELARVFGAEIVVVHVLTPIPVVEMPALHAGFNVDRYQEMLGENLRKALDDVIATRLGGAGAARGVLVVGHPASEIVKVSHDEGADLIVLSTHGRSGVGHLLFGSVAERVVRSASCPVLTIRAR